MPQKLSGNVWPDGATWAFQGTVAEDATAGTHISSLTVTPGAGSELYPLYGFFIAGAGAANLCQVFIDDGSNVLVHLIPTNLSLASGGSYSFPTTETTSGAHASIGSFLPVTGAMRFVMRVSTATISLTHTFAVACRIQAPCRRRPSPIRSARPS